MSVAIGNTTRVQQVQQLYLEGLTIHEIAERLNIDPKLALLYHGRGRATQRPLTDRERQVAELVITGMESQAIGDSLGLSRRTIELHRTYLMRKLGARNTAELVAKLKDAEIETLCKRLAELEAIIASQAAEIDRLKGHAAAKRASG